MLFKVISAIVNNKPIDIYNNGELYCVFTYVGDLVYSIKSLINIIPSNNKNISNFDSLPPVAPYRVVNISNSNKN
jgi:UDP-glucuronate 4-epimerase